jgi:hypothetical protein
MMTEEQKDEIRIDLLDTVQDSGQWLTRAEIVELCCEKHGGPFYKWVEAVGAAIQLGQLLPSGVEQRCTVSGFPDMAYQVKR